MSDAPCCPHCQAPLPIDDSDWYPRHTSYWGEESPRAHDCRQCGIEIYVRERVSRSWDVGRTPDEAEYG